MSDSNVVRIQQALITHGFLPGVIDGVWGRRTIAAVRAFQTSKGISPDGIVGPITSAALFGNGDIYAGAPVLPWMVEAEHLKGTKEVLGVGSNQTILNWAADLDIQYSGDDIPWCGLFVAHCIAATLTAEILPTNPLGARQWSTFGDPTTPRLGAVMVFWRESKTSGKGHVGFYTGESANAYRILGGNQSNQVSLVWVGKDRLLKARWPRSALSLGGGPAIVTTDNLIDLSTDEV